MKKGQYNNSATREKRNIKVVIHKMSATPKKCNMKIVEHE